MKRVVEVLFLYTAIIFGVCIGISFLYGNLPVVLDIEEKSYTYFRGLSWFLVILPAVLISGFMIGCAVQWKSNAEDSREKFSPAMLKRYKKVVLIGVMLTAVLTFSAEFFTPVVKNKLTAAEANPGLLSKYLNLGKEALLKDKPMLAFSCAEQAYAIYPKNEEVAGFYQQAKDAKDLALANAAANPENVVKIQTPIETHNKGSTVLELIEKSKAAAAKKEWLNAHYWATLAVTACSGTDTNLEAAKTAANTAWNELSNPVPFTNPDGNIFFVQKKNGYEQLVKGDNLKAYYIFSQLSASSKEHAADPDVQQYLAIAKERVESQYFFLDETENIKDVETTRNIYFALPHSDGTFDVYYIRGIATMKQMGGMVRYLDGLNVISYDRNGKFIKAMSVDYAKMLEESASVFSDEQKKALGISDKVKTVPYIQLRAVDRKTEGVISKPVYTYAVTDLPNEIADKIADQSWFKIKKEEMLKNRKDLKSVDRDAAAAEKIADVFAPASPETVTLLLPMPYEDFDLLNEASYGAAYMSFFPLLHFIPKSISYGYSEEVYTQNLVRRGAYPLFLLILIVFAAAFAWNYRLGERQLFKFKWLFFFPIFSAVMYILLECCLYLYTLLNYVFVGTCGPFALLVAFIVYSMIFIAVSINFVSRRSS